MRTEIYATHFIMSNYWKITLEPRLTFRQF